MVKPAWASLWKMRLSLAVCSLIVFEATIKSSRYSRHVGPMRPDMVIDMSRLKKIGAFLRPKGILLKWKCPLGVVKAVRGRLCVSSSTCQNPLDKSMVEKKLWPAPMSCSKSLRMGMGNLSGMVILFSCL